MSWTDDSWRDSYDSWKLASPDEEYDSEDQCDHDDYDVDIVTGRASCSNCLAHWYVRDEEIQRQIEHEATYHEHMERENRRQWWSDLFYNLRHPLRAAHWQLQKRGWLQHRAISDDDIPF
jgi:hypothetical protein